MRASGPWNRGLHVVLCGAAPVLGLGLGLGVALAGAPEPAGVTAIGAGAPEHGAWLTPSHAESGADCVSCHAVEAAFSHPVGFTPARSLPDAFPLEHGRMTCATCHDGADGARHRLARSSGDPMLRTDLEGAAFCAQCHDSSLGSSADAHARGVARAHLIWPDRARRDTRDSVSGTLDPESASCMECHDGTMAMDAGSRARGSMLSNVAQDHPVGIAYANADPSDPPTGMRRLVPADALDHRVRLFGGAVGCGSCHSVYSPHDDLLVMDNHASRLCLSCHAGR